MYKLVLMRHGESTWNLENRFTGWADVDLTEKGCAEARRAGRLLREAGFVFDIGFSSLLKRAIRTLWLALDEMDMMWVPITLDWRLNERHYGALQGLNKKEIALKYGEDMVHKWRRSFDIPPNALEPNDPRTSYTDPRYAHLQREQIPLAECLRDTVARVEPMWNDTIAPAIRAGKNVIVSAHGNSLRALIKMLDNISDEDIVSLSIPNGIPIVYELDAELKPIRHYDLGEQPKAVAPAPVAAATR